MAPLGYRKREREMAPHDSRKRVREMAPLPEKTLVHFTHFGHPLTEVYAETEFLCSGCRTPGSGRRYRCESCDFVLHDHCGTCPSVLSSFMDEHDLKLVVRKPQALCQNDRICDLCEDPVEGMFYQCKLCEFDAHPLCTQLPEKVHHVMHKDHPLRLQRSVPGKCVVCKDECPSWHYRCGICSFDLHPECVLIPCEVKPTSESTLKRPVTAPPPPPLPLPSVSPYFYGYHPPYYRYGAIQPASYYPPPHYNPYFPPPPHYNPYPQGYGIPSSSGGDVINSHQQSNGQGALGKVRKKMYAIAGNLALGVLSNLVFGEIEDVFS